MVKLIVVNVNLSRSLVERTNAACVDAIQALLEQFFPKGQADVRPDRIFEKYPEVYVIVDPSPIFSQKPSRHQGQYYSVKFKRHCIKIQALVTADG
jgi:hypothetical protein